MRGFTLVELVTVLVILSILAMLAWPSWREHVMKVRRADAQGALVELATRLERYRAGHRSYRGATLGNTSTSVYTPVSGDGHYRLSIDRQTDTDFRISAMPTGKQSGDRCGRYILDSTGLRSLDNNRLSLQQCWPS